MEVKASTEERKKLKVALSGANRKPFLPGTPAAGRPGDAGRPSG